MFNERALISFGALFSLGMGPASVILFSQGNQKKSKAIKLANEPSLSSREIAERAFKKMYDYSFKMFLGCGAATAWILDYEIPEGEHYPSTWYIATNAHVVSELSFVDNPYEQELSKPLRNKSISDWFPSISLNTDNTCALQKNGYFDLSFSRQENGRKLGSNYGAIRGNKIKEPKLFYFPINFLKKMKIWELKIITIEILLY